MKKKVFNKRIIILISFFALIASIYLLYLPFYFNHFHTTGIFFTVDSFLYLTKSLEITSGNFTSVRTHAVGWPLFAAPLFYLLKIKSVFVGMVWGQLLNILLAVFALIPLYLIGQQFLNYKKTLFALTLTAFSFWFMYSALEFSSEPLFTLILLFTIYFTVKSQTKPGFIILAAALAGIAYWIRPNGLFLLPIIIISFWIYHRLQPTPSTIHPNPTLNHTPRIIFAIILFFIISFPFLYQRYLYFGSPLSYGENSNYFADNYSQLWNPNQPTISFTQYLNNHSFPEIFSRFFIHGLGSAFFTLLVISLPLTFFFLWGLLTSIRNKKFLPLHLTLLIWLVGIAPLYAVYFTPRYFFPLIPIISLFTAIGLSRFAEKTSHPKSLYSLALLLVLFFFAVGFVYPQYYFLTKRPAAALAFGRWAAQNLHGKIAASAESAFIYPFINDLTFSQQGLFNPQAPAQKFAYPGSFPDNKSLHRWLTANNFPFLIINQDYTNRINQQPIIHRGPGLAPPLFNKIYESQDTTSSWNTTVYQIK